ncbi:hypothetical protein ONE63_010527 [Megalurothrips usitatus]|uniref:MI domain-containing protein n=1 Tax=Megalurothrips usitatus TaxID=439358 RepID=A0AAV7XD60_9NEOP|nr:hypothetical protein ONE63_010527 [Megalurothrips usitatus]
MSSPAAKDERNDSESEGEHRSDSEPPPTKKAKKADDHISDTDEPQKGDSSKDVDDKSKEKKKREGSSDEGDHEDSKSKKDQKEDKDSRRGREKDQDRDRDYERGRGKDRRRRDRDDHYEPPANYERYWGSGPKRGSYRDRDRDSDRRDYDRDRRYKGRGRDYGSGKVGPRYYGGKDKEQEESRKSRRDRDDPEDEKEKSKDSENKGEVAATKAPERKVIDMLTSKTGGAYIPPAKLRMMQAQITDKSSAAYQRIAWEALKKSIHGHINKVNTGNLATVIRELLKENLVRGCGLLCRSIIQAQAASPTFTRVFAALVAVINSRFPQIGELLLKRVVINFKRGFRRQDKASCISSAIFIAHLVNQCVAHELLALEILVLLVENPTSDSVEVAIAFLKEVVDKLLEVAKKGTMAIQDMLRNILHEGTLDKRVQYIIETMFQIIKVGGSRKLDDEQKQKEDEELLTLVEEEDQITHIINLDDAVDPQNILDVFKEDTKYEENEASYKKLLHEILGSDSESGEEGSDEDEDDDDSDEDSDGEKKADTIIDNTETNLVALRRTIYLTIQSSLDFEECAHKLMRMQLKPGQEQEMCHMILDCCAEMRTYEKFFGLLAQRFCMINKMYITPFQQIFIDSFATVHRLDINKLRNVAKFFSHLLYTDAISWDVLSTCRLTEEDSTSSSRIFIKILFQELSEYMGLPKLNNRVKDPTLQLAFEGLFPRDDPKNTRFAINFFTSIGLGGLTDELREHLKTQPRTPAVTLPVKNVVEELSSSSSSSDSSSSSSSDSDSSSDSEDEKKKKKKKNKDKMVKTKELGQEPSRKSSKRPERGRDEHFERGDKRDFEREHMNAFDKSSGNSFMRDDRRMGKDKERGEGRENERPDRRERKGDDRPSKKDFDRPDRRGDERGERRDADRGERRDNERGERRDTERGERKNFERTDKRDFERGMRRDVERGDRRDNEQGERRDAERSSKRDPDKMRKEREQRRDDDDDDDYDGKRGHQRIHEEVEMKRGSEKERRRETDNHEKERSKHYERESESNRNGDRDRPRERDRHRR